MCGPLGSGGVPLARQHRKGDVQAGTRPGWASPSSAHAADPTLPAVDVHELDFAVSGRRRCRLCCMIMSHPGRGDARERRHCKRRRAGKPRRPLSLTPEGAADPLLGFTLIWISLDCGTGARPRCQGRWGSGSFHAELIVQDGDGVPLGIGETRSVARPRTAPTIRRRLRAGVRGRCRSGRPPLQSKPCDRRSACRWGSR